MIAHSTPDRSHENTMVLRRWPSFKTTPPSASGILPRERLFEALDVARSRPVLWISGPPGSGKTSLVASYLAARDCQSLWYRIDESDADTSAFLRTLHHSISGADSARVGIAPFQARATKDRLIRHINHFPSRQHPSSILVLDDYHKVPAGSSFHDILSAAIPETPVGETTIIISRSDPPPTFARRFANQLMATLTWRDLRLTPDELGTIVDFHGARPAPLHLQGRFLERIDGWVAGLQLILARAHAQGFSIESLDERISDLFSDYFTEEILKTVEPEVRHFMLATAFLPTMSAQMTSALTGNPDAGRILDELVRNNIAFRHSNGPAACAYHPLFREFLVARVLDELSTGEVRRLSLSSAELLQQAGQVEEAVKLRAEINDWTGCARTLEVHASTLAAQGRLQVLEQWTTRLPRQVLDEYPWLLYWRALGLRRLNPRQSRSCLERALDLFRARGERIGSLMAWYEIGIELQMQPSTPRNGFERWIACAEPLLGTTSGVCNNDAEARAHLALFFARCNPRFPRHVPHASQDLPCDPSTASTTCDDRSAEMRACLALRHLLTGGSETAPIGLLRQSGSISVDQLPPDTAILKLLADALYYWRCGMLETSFQTTRDGLALAKSSGARQWDFLLRAQALSCALSMGDLSSARELLDVMHCELDKQPPLLVSNYRYLAAWDAYLRGDYDSSLTHAGQALDSAQVASNHIFEGLAHLALAQIYVAQKARPDATRHIQAAQEILAQVRSPLLMLMHHLALAQIALDADDAAAATDALSKAFALAREKNYVNFPWWAPEVMACLCSKALAANIETPYVETLIRKRNLIPVPPLDRFEHWPWCVKIFTLGKFEVVINGTPLRFSRKVQKKPLELLKFLLAQGGQNVGEQHILGALWPEAEGDAAHRACAIALHRLRRLLGTECAVVLTEGEVSLDLRYCWVDCLSFQARGGITMAGPSPGCPEPAVNGSKLAPVLALYQGPFLPGDDASPWTAAMRDRLRMRFIRLVREECERLEGNGAARQAIELYQKGLEADNLAEEFYRGIMRCHLRLSQNAEALANYQRCKLLLSVVLGMKPSAEIESLHQACLRQ
jgi:ATP/maltotriose-dependent transcriptional regulator MalT/DNA-binding SARP family transcriptional activator